MIDIFLSLSLSLSIRDQNSSVCVTKEERIKRLERHAKVAREYEASIRRSAKTN